MLIEPAKQAVKEVVHSMFREDSDMAKRRGKQTGYLKVEGPSYIGYWWEEVRLVDGSLHWHRFSKKICDAVTFDPGTKRMRKVNEKEAQRLFDETILSKLDIANSNPQSLATLREFVEQKFEPSLALKKRKGQEHYRGMLKNHILPTLGHKKMREIQLDDVRDLILSKAAKGYSSQTLIHIRNTISTIFNKAKAYKWFTGDLPTFGMDRIELTHKERTAYSATQLQMLLDALNQEPLLNALVLAYTVTGLRRGELAGMKWKYLNLSPDPLVVSGEVVPGYAAAIRENYVWVYGKKLTKEQRGGKYQTLKSTNGKRNIPIPPTLVSVLTAWRNAAEFNGPDDPVFASRTRRPIDMHNYLQDHLQPIMKDLGLPVVSWHDLRHTNSTLADLHGATLTNRKRILGHGDNRMAELYSHADMDQTRGAIERIEAAVLPKPKLLRVK